MRTRLRVGIVSALLLAWISLAEAEAVSWNGFVQTHAARRTSKVDCPPVTECDYPAEDIRGEVTTEWKNESGSLGLLGRFELLSDFVENETRLHARELYGDWTSDKVAARAGRQVVTWGVGDLLFINDTFPKDPVALFTGQPVDYFKLGSDALKLNAYTQPVNLELVVAEFRADNIPTNSRFILADPFPANLPRHTVEPGDDNLEVSMRAFRYIESWELGAYVSRTHFHTPARRVVAGNVVSTFPRLDTIGASLRGPAVGGVVSLETGYYDSVQDREGRDPAIDNNQTRALIGYTRQPWEDGTIGVQIYGEWMQDYDVYRASVPVGFPVKKRVREVGTIHFTQQFANQTVTFNIFTFFGLSEKDHYFIPSVRYAFSDSLWVELGANVFGGNRLGTFGSLQDNSAMFLTVRLTL